MGVPSEKTRSLAISIVKVFVPSSFSVSVCKDKIPLSAHLYEPPMSVTTVEYPLVSPCTARSAAPAADFPKAAFRKAPESSVLLPKITELSPERIFAPTIASGTPQYGLVFSSLIFAL